MVKFGRVQEGDLRKDVESASSTEMSTKIGGVVTEEGDRRREGEGEDAELRELRELPAVGAMMREEKTRENEGDEKGDFAEGEVDVTDTIGSPRADPSERRPSSSSSPPSPSTSNLSPTPRPRHPPARGSTAEASTASAAENDLVPDAIGRETCPICIVDFEEGDDLRVLPCEGHHRFHQQCVDPWLLELSSSCPLCRQGMCF